MASRGWGGREAARGTEVVLKGVTKEADGRKRKVVLFTGQSGQQTVGMWFRTNGEEEQARNEGLTVFTGQRPGAVVWEGEKMARAGRTKDPETAQDQKQKDGAK